MGAAGSDANMITATGACMDKYGKLENGGMGSRKMLFPDVRLLLC